MRLDDYDNDIDVGDATSRGGLGGGGGGLLFGLLPLIGSRFGCGGIVVVLLIFAVFGARQHRLDAGRRKCAGHDVAQRIGRHRGTADLRRQPGAAHDLQRLQQRGVHVGADLRPVRRALPRARPALLRRAGQSGCGAAMAATGPFYCPTDSDIYLDTRFFDELANRFKAPGDFAQYYVVAHEFGHHIQNLLGTAEQVRQAQARGSEAEGNAASVRLELQADCYAGVWAAKNRDPLEPGDVEEGMRAAQAIGDDTLQREAGGRVMPDSFTHGTSAQRMTWLRRGMETGDPAACDTFSGAI
ncbi:KPN_02809 family neutral zinc metallopeptidase [Sphingomonas sp. MMS24-JH45]